MVRRLVLTAELSSTLSSSILILTKKMDAQRTKHNTLPIRNDVQCFLFAEAEMKNGGNNIQNGKATQYHLKFCIVQDYYL
jgi:hypothetical protein